MTLCSVLASTVSHVLAYAPEDKSLLFTPWEGSIFQKERWEGFTKFVRLFLTVTTALFLMYEMRAGRLRERIPPRVKRTIAWVLTALAFFVYFDFFNPNVRYVEYYHRHEFFHYYLGSKYFREIGYNDLYLCTAVAEIELGRGAAVAKREVRDLRVNLIKDVKDTYVLTDPGQCKNRFTAERWEAYKQDVDWFYHSSVGSYWDNMQKDHGYNPPPVWGMAGRFFASFAPAGDQFFKLLACIDIALHAGCVLLFYWAFGFRIMAIATVFWGCQAPADFYWTGGAFMRQDWLFFLVAALCLARKRKFTLAGIALTWSGLLRIFPLVFFGGVGLIVLFEIIRRYRFGTSERPVEEPPPTGKPVIYREPGLLGYLHPDHRRLIAGVLIALGTLIPGSIAVCGVDSYKEFYGHTLNVLQHTPLTNTMGLETMLVSDWNGRMRFLRDDNMEDPFEGWKHNRLQRFKMLKPVFLLICVGVFGWLAWALRRTKLIWVGIALGPVLVASLTNVTCYYYSFFIVMAAVAAVRPGLGPVIVMLSGVSKLMQYGPSGFFWVDDRFVAQSWLFYVVGLMMLWGYSRPFSMNRLKAWWDCKPEPRSGRRAPALVDTATAAKEA